MATAITTAGDLIKGTGSGTFDRLGIGSTGQVLTVSAGAPAWASPAGGGKLLQLVNNTYSTNFSTTSTSYVDTGMSATITPTLSTSKIYIVHNGNYAVSTAGGAVNIRILRGSTVLKTYNAQHYNANTLQRGEITTVWYDSPATTSATTYKIMISNDQTTNIEAQLNGEPSVMTLMEIGA
jgi:hypothetical protein